jgi:cell division GTPase FtsZ
MSEVLEKNKNIFIVGLGGAGINIVTSTPTLFPMKNIVLINMDDRISLSKDPVAGRFYLGSGLAYSVEDVRRSIHDAIAEIISVISDSDCIVIVSGASGKTGSQAPYLARELLLANKKVALALMKPMAFESPRHYPQAIDDLNMIAEQCLWHELFSWELSSIGGMEQLVSKTNQRIMGSIVTRVSHTNT